MTPLASAVVLFALAIAVIALFAWRLRRVAGPADVAVLPEPAARAPTVAPAPSPRGSFEGALIRGD